MRRERRLSGYIRKWSNDSSSSLRNVTKTIPFAVRPIIVIDEGAYRVCVCDFTFNRTISIPRWRTIFQMKVIFRKENPRQRLRSFFSCAIEHSCESQHIKCVLFAFCKTIGAVQQQQQPPNVLNTEKKEMAMKTTMRRKKYSRGEIWAKRRKLRK